MPDADHVQPVPPAARAWDWRAELRAQERDVMWLSRHSGIHYRTMYRLANAEQDATDGQIRAIARALGRGGPDGADL